MPVLRVERLTKNYGHDRGVFDVSFSVEQGEVFGFLGPNGAGKTTTIRHLMGFLKPQKGSATINGLDCWHQSADIKQLVGYVPGEIAFPDYRTGLAFIKGQAELMKLDDLSYAETLMETLQLDATANLKRMSKGMKQKTAIVAALMTDPQILILDEPTTGLDPLMRRAFIQILQEEKEKGKTIFMSSHMFDEVEHICDKVAMIKDGRIIDIIATAEIKHNPSKIYKIMFKTQADFKRFLTEDVTVQATEPSLNEVVITSHDRDINTLLKVLKQYELKRFTENKSTLEHYFKSLY